MELTYTKVGDYYIPDLIVSEGKRSIGKYGRLRRKYLKEHQSMVYFDMVLSDKLWQHLADIEEQAQQRMDVIIHHMKDVEGVTEELKAREQMEWVRRMNNICNRAEEIVLQEFVYQ